MIKDSSFVACKQLSGKPACTYGQCDQCLCYSLIRNIYIVIIYNCKIFDILATLKLKIVSANRADRDEMPYSVAFHLGLHCMQKYLFRGYMSTKS